MTIQFQNSEITTIIQQLANVAIELKTILETAELENKLDVAGGANASGDNVQKMDLIAHDCTVDALRQIASVRYLGTEEVEEIIELNPSGEYAIFIDPLDGSSNLKHHLPVGLIFGIWPANKTTNGLPATGADLVAAGYVHLGTSTILVASDGGVPISHCYDPRNNSWPVSVPAVKTPDTIKYFSLNEANRPRWSAEMCRVHDDIRTQAGGRYVGAMVADLHRNLFAGGVFMYPADSASANGKLRLLYECAPLGWLYERAGGKASDGNRPIVDIPITALHQRVPVFIGSRDSIDKIEQTLRTAS